MPPSAQGWQRAMRRLPAPSPRRAVLLHGADRIGRARRVVLADVPISGEIVARYARSSNTALRGSKQHDGCDKSVRRGLSGDEMCIECAEPCRRLRELSSRRVRAKAADAARQRADHDVDPGRTRSEPRRRRPSVDGARLRCVAPPTAFATMKPNRRTGRACSSPDRAHIGHGVRRRRIGDPGGRRPCSPPAGESVRPRRAPG